MSRLALLPFGLCLLFLGACRKQSADLLLYHGVIYTVDSPSTVAQAIAVKDGKILATGTDEEIRSTYAATTETDLHGHAVYPGFIDAHSHFYGYATDLLKLDLTGTNSFSVILDSVTAFSKRNRFSWILGRGWDQNDWQDKSFPERSELDRLFPNQPVFLMRIDGHAALCNGAALKIAGIDNTTKVEGGEILLKDANPTGLLIDNAVALVASKIPAFPESLNAQALLMAANNCFKAGLTTVSDAGLGKDSIELIRKMQHAQQLRIRVNAMISCTPATMNHYLKTGPIVEDLLTVRAIKVYADGALGSRGALLKAPYTDQEHHTGLSLCGREFLESTAHQSEEHGFQLCTHAIGDAAVKMVMDVYEHQLKGKNDLRWRIEHCQVVDDSELDDFSAYSIIPSVQPTHATSDMYWAEERLGPERIKHAYRYKDLLNAAGTIAFGTDFPVEQIDPLMTFYAATVRKDRKGFPADGFQPENKVSRQTALRAMTIQAAYANFEETKKGSLSAGKFADFVVLDKDIMKVTDEELPTVKVIATYLAGEKVF